MSAGDGSSSARRKVTSVKFRVGNSAGTETSEEAATLDTTTTERIGSGILRTVSSVGGEVEKAAPELSRCENIVGASKKEESGGGDPEAMV